MRIDIPKRDLPPEALGQEGKKYNAVEFLDPEPMRKRLQEILKWAKQVTAQAPRNEGKNSHANEHSGGQDDRDPRVLPLPFPPADLGGHG